jgi:hypothetical protein
VPFLRKAMNRKKPTNEEIANLLEEVADLLELQQGNPHRIRAYRAGAERLLIKTQGKVRTGKLQQRLDDLQSAETLAWWKGERCTARRTCLPRRQGNHC